MYRCQRIHGKWIFGNEIDIQWWVLLLVSLDCLLEIRRRSLDHDVHSWSIDEVAGIHFQHHWGHGVPSHDEFLFDLFFYLFYWEWQFPRWNKGSVCVRDRRIILGEYQYLILWTQSLIFLRFDDDGPVIPAYPYGYPIREIVGDIVETSIPPITIEEIEFISLKGKDLLIHPGQSTCSWREDQDLPKNVTAVNRRDPGCFMSLEKPERSL